MGRPTEHRAAASASTGAGRWRDEPSMRLLELAVAALSLAGAVILALAR